MKPPDPGTPRLRDAAALLPVLAVFLLMPPVITLFTDTRTVGGVPMIVAYLFGVWLALIVAAALLAHRLAPPAAASPDAVPLDAASPGGVSPGAPPPHTAPPGAPATPAPRD